MANNFKKAIEAFANGGTVLGQNNPHANGTMGARFGLKQVAPAPAPKTPAPL